MADYPRVTHPCAAPTTEYCYPVISARLACLIHAASVRSEPESNSPLKNVSLIPVRWLVGRITILKLSTDTTNWLSVKGLSLIAQFNFQWAMGVSTRKSQYFEGHFSRFRGQKTWEPIISLQLGLSDLRLLRNQFYPHRADCQRFIIYFNRCCRKNVNKIS